MFCSKCGNRLPDGARFCGRCGSPVEAVPESPERTVPPAAGSAEAAAPAAGQAQPENVRTEPEAQNFLFSAMNASGEALYAVVGGTAGKAADLIPGPGKTLWTGIKSFFSSAAAAFRDPKILIPAAVLAVLWIVLGLLRSFGVDMLPTRILSFATFAGGGMSGGIAGLVGGIIGKGVLAGAVVSLIGLFTRKRTGGKRSFGEAFLGVFGVSADTLWAYLTGIGAAMLLYLFMSGGSTRSAFVCGIAAAFLSGRAALGNGFLKRFLSSFTPKGRAGAGWGAAGLIRGLTVGFAAAAFIGLSGINLILIIPGAVLFAGGAVMMILQATGAVRIGKGAAAQ